MQEPTLSKTTVSFGLSLAVCAVLNALLVVAKEKSKAVQSWMQKITGHHWVTHALILLVAFFLCGWFFARGNRGQDSKILGERLANIVMAGVVAGVLIIWGFYLIGD